MTHSLPTRRSSDLTSAISKIDRPSGGGGRIAAADDATPAAIGEIGGEPDRVPDEEPRDRRCRQADEKIETAEDRERAGDIGLRAAEHPLRIEIGRASWRERVWQYV